MRTDAILTRETVAVPAPAPAGAAELNTNARRILRRLLKRAPVKP
jgi:hypothetical protein